MGLAGSEGSSGVVSPPLRVDVAGILDVNVGVDCADLGVVLVDPDVDDVLAVEVLPPSTPPVADVCVAASEGASPAGSDSVSPSDSAAVPCSDAVASLA